MPRHKSLRIGIITSRPECFAGYFPTAAEPELVPVEPGITPDDQRLVDELRRRGHTIDTIAWDVDEPQTLASRFDLLIVRSPWDYMDSDAKRESFLGWLALLGELKLPVENHPAVMPWLMDKRYLLDFAVAGVPIVPTTVADATRPIALDEWFVRQGKTIVKPAISAAGAGLVFVTSGEQAREFQREFDDRRQLSAQLLQPFLPEIQTAGEWSLVYLDGRYSHAVHKLPGSGKILVHAEQGGSLRFADPPDAVLQAGDRVAANIAAAYRVRHGDDLGERAFPLLYVRIDLIETAAGVLLSECEGVEPELFFRAREGSEQACCDGIERRWCIQ
jgi:glutathione synthase/RimK-type ligase-like ATP-grasp enzyme